ncbi:MAG: ATP-binding cassette domain-containing protein, partial [Candidatus Zixiibacteriota bacterium]
MIQLKNITKYYTSGFTNTYVLRNVNLEIREGEFVCLMGPSGAGKSTLLNIIGMLDEASEGEYRFFDSDVHNLKEKQRASLYKEYIGFVFQS